MATQESYRSDNNRNVPDSNTSYVNKLPILTLLILNGTASLMIVVSILGLRYIVTPWNSQEMPPKSFTDLQIVKYNDDKKITSSIIEHFKLFLQMNNDSTNTKVLMKSVSKINKPYSV